MDFSHREYPFMISEHYGRGFQRWNKLTHSKRKTKIKKKKEPTEEMLKLYNEYQKNKNYHQVARDNNLTYTRVRTRIRRVVKYKEENENVVSKNN